MVEIKLCDWFGQMLSNFAGSQIQVVIPKMNKVVLVWNELRAHKARSSIVSRSSNE